MVFTRSAITPPKVNADFNEISNSVSHAWGLTLADSGRDPSSCDSLRGIVFFEKTQKLLTKSPGLVPSGRHNSAMITDRRKFTDKWSLYGMSSLHFYC